MWHPLTLHIPDTHLCVSEGQTQLVSQAAPVSQWICREEDADGVVKWGLYGSFCSQIKKDAASDTAGCLPNPHPPTPPCSASLGSHRLVRPRHRHSWRCRFRPRCKAPAGRATGKVRASVHAEHAVPESAAMSVLMSILPCRQIAQMHRILCQEWGQWGRRSTGPHQNTSQE